ncbi:DNA-directed RNA polymerase subunit L [Candidatus Woesearchaeota archaeon]|nr:DNA-directed RNA polymerase subunit L [Candidatus Woesearchaeota archaeon]
MELEVREDKKSRFEFKLFGEDHTFCNALRDELWNDKEVTIAAYNIKHPLISEPIFVVETTSKKEPRKALKDALKRLDKKNEEFLKEFSKAK